VEEMAQLKQPPLLVTSQVERPSAGVISIGTQHRAYRHDYFGAIELDGRALRLHEDSWIWKMLVDVAEFHKLESAAPEAKMKQLAAAFKCLAADKQARALLDLRPPEVTISNVKALFRRGDKLVLDGKFEGSGGPRAMGTFRTFVFEQADCVDLAETIDEQTVRFKPQARVESDPRALISDLTDLADTASVLPIGATAVQSAVDLRDAIYERAMADLQRVREACIREMQIAAAVRERVNDWNRLQLEPRHVLAAINSLRNGAHPERPFEAANVPFESRLLAILQVIKKQGLARKEAPYKYGIAASKEMRAQLFEGFPVFNSLGIFEIAQHACAEEVFAAFHLLQTQTSWNFSSVMALTEDRVQMTAKSVIIQGFKDKTNDDTPEVEIDLSEPGISMVIELLKWNRQQLILLGHLHKDTLDLWAVARKRKTNQEAHTFHPAQRHYEFKKRHGLPDYSLDQVRTQFLFVKVMSKGGIQASQLYAGHSDISTTGGYVENIIQDRLSSAMNLAFTKQLESELVYVHESKTRDLHTLELTLLRPIGDGTSCANPSNPPAGRSREPGACDAKRCHLDGGCPNRRVEINTARIEEVVRTRFHHQATWQWVWQSNPDRFAKHQLPAILFNEALYQVLMAGPFAAKVHRMQEEVFTEVRNGKRP
jgi:hypothetical protein